MVDLKQSLEIALGSIFSSKLRSTLTTLGIVIGVAAVIANVSLGASFNQYFDEEIGTIGSNFIYVGANEPNTFFDNELEVVRKTPGVLRASPINEQVAEVTYMSDSRRVSITGVTGDYDEVANIGLSEGNFIKDNDQYVAVIGYEVSDGTFDRKLSNKNSIDITFRTRDGGEITQTFQVKGIVQESEPSFISGGMVPDKRIFIPISTMNEILSVNDYSTIFAEGESIEKVSETSEEIDKRLGRYLGISSRDMEEDDIKPYFIVDQQELLENAGALSSALSGLLTAVAFISLVVGSIGIMNIMLVTVTERTSEIGLMKAIGYSNFDVLTMFIVESAVVGTIGGVLGVILGCAGAYGAATFMNLPVVLPASKIFAGFVVSIFVGLIAGAYPANKAAKMKPVDALRHD
ncbi:ABC transporter permease [Methanococcoides alaskense]|uniref:ABC transport system permease protein n=1 Tax=Methanococcoides alaskense TaxID=325778 RepID=A0AA90U0T1_9EURY|nr:ABC transporter permease [Methanococcoides alaskense]MDA0524380.1 ABC transporter permease [Methanococcoides alaskense]MDR6223194.1 putative ABC transport system permease protein [Methanococcoides alaskense]